MTVAAGLVSPGAGRRRAARTSSTRSRSVRGQQVVVDLKLPRGVVGPRGLRLRPARRVLVRRRRRAAAVAVSRHGSDPSPPDRRVPRSRSTRRRTGEWIAFLSTLPVDVRAKLVPHASSVDEARLRRRFAQAPRRRRDVAARLPADGAAVRGARRRAMSCTQGGSESARQDWLPFPVAGVSPSTMRSATSRGCATPIACPARACAPSSNGNGPRAAPTTGSSRTATSSRPRTRTSMSRTGGSIPRTARTWSDSHPASRSPFGVDDLAGNVFELVASARKQGEIVDSRRRVLLQADQLSQHQPRTWCRATFRDVTTGIRVCASTEERL